MRNLIIIICSLFVSSVFGGDLFTGLNRFRQLQELQELTVKLEKEGKYSTQLRNAIKVDIDELSFHIFTRSNTGGSQVSFSDANQISALSSFNTDLKTVIYIHGWIDTVDGDGAVLVKDSLLTAAALNVLILDWDKCANSINYLTSWGCVEGIGNYLGAFLTTIRETYGYSLSDVTIVGHSLGAHIAGYSGKYTNGTLGVIVGLDAAGPLFFEDQRDNRLNEDDAQFVQAVHTCARLLGVNFNVGRADFWPNGGYSQVGCGLDLFGQCAHVRAFAYYAESLASNDFYGRKCGSFDDFEDEKCNDNEESWMAGLNIDTSSVGDYYLETNKNSPYGKGNL